MYTELAEKLMNINSRSKGDLLKEAALAIATLEEQLRQMTVERDVSAKKLREIEVEQKPLSCFTRVDKEYAEALKKLGAVSVDFTEAGKRIRYANTNRHTEAAPHAFEAMEYNESLTVDEIIED